MNWIIKLNQLERDVKALTAKVSELTEKVEQLETQPKRKLERFIPPTESQVALYAFNNKKLSDLDAKVFAHTFVAHYESNGWMVGKNKMRSWEAAIRKWNIEPSKTTTNTIKNGKFNAGDAERIANDAAAF